MQASYFSVKNVLKNIQKNICNKPVTVLCIKEDSLLLDKAVI